MNKEIIETKDGEIVENTTFEQDIATIKDVTTKAFLVTGKVLQGIQADKKYKEAGYKTFKEAVEIELGLKQSRAYQLMDAVVVYENFHNCGTFLPTNESQIRPLAKLLPEQQLEVWQEVAKDKVPTAKEVENFVKEKFPKPAKEKKKETKKEQEPANVVDNTIVQDLQIEIEQLKEKIKELQGVCMQAVSIEAELMQYKQTYGELVSTVDSSTNNEEDLTISREKAFEFIKSNGNDIQIMAITSETLPNEKLFNLLEAVKREKLKHLPPSSIESSIINAKGIK